MEEGGERRTSNSELRMLKGGVGNADVGSSGNSVAKERLSYEMERAGQHGNCARFLPDMVRNIPDQHRMAHRERLSWSVKGIRARVAVKCPLKCWLAGTKP